MNICGCLIHTMPARADAVAVDLQAIDGVEIHGRSEDGRFVVVIEDTESRLASDTIMALHQLDGVVSLTLTYHHFEDLSETSGTLETTAKAGAQAHDHS